MRTPDKPTRVRRTNKVASHFAAVLPWGAEAGRIAVQQGGALPMTAARQQLRESGRTEYPFGKAVARQAYLLQQRGLALDLPGKPEVARPRRSRAALARFSGLSALAEPLPVLDFKTQAKAATPAWRELGPTLVPHGQTYGSGPGSTPSVSGRCVAVVVDRADSRHIIVCSAGGGLWGSRDAGATWRALTDNQPTLVMGALAQSASAPAIMYAATGDGRGRIPFGIGLLRSADSGETWEAVPVPALQGSAAYRLAVHPSNPLLVCLAADLGLFISKNGGEAFQQPLQGRCWSVSINPSQPNEIFACTDSGLQRSIDTGASWQAVSLPGLAAGAEVVRLEFSHAHEQGDVGYAAGCIAGQPMLWRRSAFGGAFSALAAPEGFDAKQAWYDWSLGVVPGSPDDFYWGGVELYRGSFAGGSVNWVNISSRSSGDSIHPDQQFVGFDLRNPQAIYACSDGGLYVSPDLGNSWASLNAGLGITEFEFVAHLPSDPTWLIGGTQDNGSLFIVGDRRWDQVALGDGGDCAAVDRGPSSICYHSYYNMPLERARAYGPSAFAWTSISPPVVKGYQSLFYPPVDAKGTSVAKAGSSIWVSGDEGKSWTELSFAPASGPPGLATALTFFDDNNFLVGTAAGMVFGVGRAAQSDWSDATVSLLAELPTGYVSDVCVAGSSPELWVSCSHPGQRVFHMASPGATPEDRTGDLPAAAVNTIVADPEDTACVYVGTDKGVFRTLDGGTKWARFGVGMPNAIVSCLLLHKGSRQLRAATRSRGLWEVDV